MKLLTLSKRDRVAYTAHIRRVRDELRRIARKAASSPPVAGRKQVSREQVQEKTDGNCHMCGDSLKNSWQIGHVKPHHICAECKRLRWSYTPELLRFMLLFGRYAKQAIRGRNGKPTDLGEELIKLHVRSTWSHKKRASRAY